MSEFDTSGTVAVAAHAEAPAERLLFSQYRSWMAGYSTRDIACWEVAWNALADTMGLDGARPLYGEFQSFVRTILLNARRDIGWRPAACRCLCADELLVLALIEATQRRDHDAAHALAVDLLGRDDCAALVEAARSLGRAMAERDLVLTRLEPVFAASHPTAGGSLALH